MTRLPVALILRVERSDRYAIPNPNGSQRSVFQSGPRYAEGPANGAFFVPHGFTSTLIDSRSFIAR